METESNHNVIFWRWSSCKQKSYTEWGSQWWGCWWSFRIWIRRREVRVPTACSWTQHWSSHLVQSTVQRPVSKKRKLDDSELGSGDDDDRNDRSKEDISDDEREIAEKTAVVQQVAIAKHPGPLPSDGEVRPIQSSCISLFTNSLALSS